VIVEPVLGRNAIPVPALGLEIIVVPTLGVLLGLMLAPRRTRSVMIDVIRLRLVMLAPPIKAVPKAFRVNAPLPVDVK